MKQWIWHAWLIFCLTYMSLPAYAQDSDETTDEDRSITIHYSTLYHQNTPELLNLIGILQDELSPAFENSGITPIVERDPDFAAIQIMFDFADDYVFIDFDAVPPLPTLLPSSYLIPHPFYNFPLFATADNPFLRQTIHQFSIALGHYLNANCEKALPYFDSTQQAIIQIQEFDYPNEAIAYLNFYRANCAIAAQDLETARELYDDILAFFTMNGYDFRYGLETRLNLAWTYYQLGDEDTAYDLLNDIISFTGIDWASVRALELRAHFHTEEENYDEAIDDLDTALEIHADDPYLIGQIIHIFIILKDFKAADKEITRLHKTQNGYPIILYYQGLLAYAEGDTSTAEEYLSQFVARGLNDHLTLAARALLTNLRTR